jgi:hypothetical protein
LRSLAKIWVRLDCAEKTWLRPVHLSIGSPLELYCWPLSYWPNFFISLCLLSWIWTLQFIPGHVFHILFIHIFPRPFFSRPLPDPDPVPPFDPLLLRPIPVLVYFGCAWIAGRRVELVPRPVWHKDVR